MAGLFHSVPCKASGVCSPEQNENPARRHSGLLRLRREMPVDFAEQLCTSLQQHFYFGNDYFVCRHHQWKASFAGSNLTEEQKRPDVLAEMLFDSLLQPLLEGIRSSSNGTRHIVYRADPFQIDLLIESQTGGRSVVVTGQLLDLCHPEIAGHDLRVTLSNLHGRVVQTATSQFGEFCQEIENSGNLELKFHGANHLPVVISLRDDLGAWRKRSLNVPCRF